MAKITKITVQFGDTEITGTLDELRVLYADLAQMFDKPAPIDAPMTKWAVPFGGYHLAAGNLDTYSREVKIVSNGVNHGPYASIGGGSGA